MLQYFKKLLANEPAPVFDPPAADVPFVAIGDVHGRSDLLDKALASIDEQMQIVLVGDYIDRGEDSAGVLRRLHELSGIRGDRLVCLKGNHEDMLLQFLDDPVGRARRWVHFGGLQTMASFGVGGASEAATEAAMHKTADHLRDAMGDELIEWLNGLPLIWTSGTVTVVHAAADPSVPVEMQDPHVLMWGHDDFGQTPRRDGQWITHGHTIVDDPIAANGVIPIDTGAYATGRLTLAEFSGSGVALRVV